MRVKVEATVTELETKGDALLKALASRLEDYNPELAEVLEKAATRKKDPKPPTRVLKDLRDITEAEYDRQIKGMIADIAKVMEGKPLRKALKKAPEADADSEPEEPLEPGDYDAKTDSIVPEPEDEEEDEDTEKSIAPQYQAGKAGITIVGPVELVE